MRMIIFQRKRENLGKKTQLKKCPFIKKSNLKSISSNKIFFIKRYLYIEKHIQKTKYEIQSKLNYQNYQSYDQRENVLFILLQKKDELYLKLIVILTILLLRLLFCIYLNSQQLTINSMFSVSTQNNQKPYYQAMRTYQLKEIPLIGRYKNNQKISANQAEMNVIQNKLIPETKGQLKCRQRIESSDYYINYSQNHFAKMPEFSGKRQQKQEDKEENINLINFINLKESFEWKKILHKGLKQVENLQQFKKDNQRICCKIISSIQKKNLLKQNQHQKSLILNKEENQMVVGLKHFQNTAKYSLDLDDILSMEQDNFFFNHMKGFDIFKLPSNKMLRISSFDHLKHKNFRFSSMIQKNFTIKIHTQRQISRLARATICGWKESQFEQKIQDKLHLDDLRISIQNITFEDLVNLATNRISPESTINLFQEASKEEKESLSEEESQAQNYKKKVNLHGKMLKVLGFQDKETNENNLDTDKDEIDKYKKIMMKDSNKKLQKLKIKESQVKQIQKDRRKMYENQIRDTKVHTQLSEKAKRAIKKILEQYQRSEKRQVDKLTRERKIYTDKDRSLFIKNFGQMLCEKKEALNTYKILERK